MTAGKETKLNTGNEVVIHGSSRENVDLEEEMGMLEFACTNTVQMTPDGSMHPITYTSIVIKLLEDFACQRCYSITLEGPRASTCLCVDVGSGVMIYMKVIRIICSRSQ